MLESSMRVTVPRSTGKTREAHARLVQAAQTKVVAHKLHKTACATGTVPALSAAREELAPACLQTCTMLSGLSKTPCKAPAPLRAARSALPRRAVPARAEKQAELDDGALSEGEGLGSNLGAFCSIDSTGRRSKSRSLAEKEMDFIEVRAATGDTVPCFHHQWAHAVSSTGSIASARARLACRRCRTTTTMATTRCRTRSSRT